MPESGEGRVPAEQGAMILKALQLAIDANNLSVGAQSALVDRAASDGRCGLIFSDSHYSAAITCAGDKDVTAETWQPIAARRADALSEMAESYLAHGTKESSSAERYQVMLHVSAETLRSNESRKNNKDDVTAVTSRRICCDSSISPLITDKNDEPF